VSSYVQDPETLKSYLDEIIRVSRGALEVLMVVKPDGTPVAYANTICLAHF